MGNWVYQNVESKFANARGEGIRRTVASMADPMKPGYGNFYKKLPSE